MTLRDKVIEMLEMEKMLLSFNQWNTHAVTPMIYFFYIPQIFLELKMIYHGYL